MFRALAPISPDHTAEQFLGGADEEVTNAEKLMRTKTETLNVNDRKERKRKMEYRKIRAPLFALCLMLSGLALAKTGSKSAPKATSAAAETKAESKTGGVVNINNATAEQLSYLPRVGMKVAQRIVDYRNANGHFKHVEDLMEVKGIGEKMLAVLRPHLSLAGPTTLTAKIKSGSSRGHRRTKASTRDA